MFVVYFDPEFFIQIMKITNYRGDLADIFADKVALLGIRGRGKVRSSAYYLASGS